MRRRGDPLTPDLRAALREAFDDARHDRSEPLHSWQFEDLLEALRGNLRRMDALGMDWRGRA